MTFAPQTAAIEAQTPFRSGRNLPSVSAKMNKAGPNLLGSFEGHHKKQIVFAIDQNLSTLLTTTIKRLFRALFILVE